MIHREFLRSYQRLSDQEQQSIQRTLQLLVGRQTTSGMRVHKVGPFLSLSPNMDLRIIAAGSQDKLTLLYVDHHDKAYAWASRRQPFATVAGIELLPAEFIADRAAPAPAELETLLPLHLEHLALAAKNPEELLDWIVDLSPEWQEWMFRTFVEHEDPRPPLPETSSLTYSSENDSDLMLALQFSLPEWRLFLHPTQDATLHDIDSSSLAITGGPGTGKTIALLRRFLDHPQVPNTKRVLFTYSANLCHYLETVLRYTVGNLPATKMILPLYFLEGDEHAAISTKTHKSYKPKGIWNEYQYTNLRQKWSFSVTDGALHFHDSMSGQTTLVEEILIDEFQDTPENVVAWLRRLRDEGGTRITVAADTAQAIHRAGFYIIQNFIATCQAHYELDYCYRSSRQILAIADTIVQQLHSTFQLRPREKESKRSFALSGPRVIVLKRSDLSAQISACNDIMRNLESRFAANTDSIALIYLQYFNPAFKGHSPEEAALKNHPLLSGYYRFASLTKGKEYLAGVIFVSKTFLAIDTGANGNQLRANTLYVALTRFRDEVTIVYPEGCAIEEALYLSQAAKLP
jgi:hypothetical protein